MNIALYCVISFASALAGIALYRMSETVVKEEKIIFVQGEDGKQMPIANLSPNGIMCVNVSELAKQKQVIPPAPIPSKEKK